jgi:hypothetical protein
MRLSGCAASRFTNVKSVDTAVTINNYGEDDTYSVMWFLARWVDDHLIEAMYPDGKAVLTTL